MNKKEREEAILREVYAREEFSVVAADERPDFVLTRHDADTTFGVEVRELYYDGTSARLTRIPTYLSELLGGGKHRHTDDLQALKVEECRLYDDEGHVQASAPGILFMTPSSAGWLGLLESAIREKGAKMAGYAAVGSHTNLLIRDRTAHLAEVARLDVYSYLFHDESMREVVFTAPFREIFYTGLVGGAVVWVPLKMFLLLAHAYMVSRALLAAQRECHLTLVQEVRCLAAYLVARGALVYLDVKSEAEALCYFGNGYLTFTPNQVALNDLADDAYGAGARRVVVPTTPALTDLIRTHSSTQTFRHPVIFDVPPSRVAAA